MQIILCDASHGYLILVLFGFKDSNLYIDFIT